MVRLRPSSIWPSQSLSTPSQYSGSQLGSGSQPGHPGGISWGPSGWELTAELVAGAARAAGPRASSVSTVNKDALRRHGHAWASGVRDMESFRGERGETRGQGCGLGTPLHFEYAATHPTGS